MKIYRIIFATFFIIISISAHSQNKKKTSSKSKKIDSITVNMKKTSGLITTYFSKEKEKVRRVSMNHSVFSLGPLKVFI